MIKLKYDKANSDKYHKLSVVKIVVLTTLYIAVTFHGISQVPVAIESIIQLRTEVSENPPSISFYWNEIRGNPEVNIFRKDIDFNSFNWIKIHTTPPGDTSFTDYNVQPGEFYEYKIASLNSGSPIPTTYVTAGIRCGETEYRGKIILLVDSMFIDSLQYELSRLEKDLIGDGWEIIRRDISRNSSVKQVKSLIRDIYFSDFINVNTLFLVGHIPVPYSGEIAFDGHDDHKGAWPADVYYGVMSEPLWTDTNVKIENRKYKKNDNVPGDGKFDPSNLGKNPTVSLAIGRVDFSDLPAFRKSEVDLMRNYLKKDHDFRHKIIHPKMQALVRDSLGPLPLTIEGDTLGYELIAISGWRNFTALFDFENVKTGNVFQDALEDSYMWTFGCGYGDLALCEGIGTTTDFVDHEPKTVFTGFYGSWFGDWNTTDNFLRAALASKGWILTSCWPGRPHYIFHHMGMGKTIGNCVRRAQNNFDTYDYGLPRYRKGIDISLMGDPTLRMHVVSPIKSLHIENTGNTISLSWQAPDDAILGYYVYRVDTVTGKCKRLNNEVITDNYFADVSPEQGNNIYMVRALQLTKSASGSYYNLSQGVFDSITVSVKDISMKKENVFIYPNPTNNHLTIETGVPDIYNIEITSINGQLLLNKVMMGAENQIDLSSYKSGVYFITVRSEDIVTTRKIIKH